AIAALRAANAVVLINFDDLAAHVGGNLAQLTFLVGRGLIDGRDPQIENSAFHRKALVFDAGTITHYVSKNIRLLVQRWRARKPLKLLVAASADLQGIFGTARGAEIHPPHIARQPGLGGASCA